MRVRDGAVCLEVLAWRAGEGEAEDEGVVWLGLLWLRHCLLAVLCGLWFVVMFGIQY